VKIKPRPRAGQLGPHARFYQVISMKILELLPRVGCHWTEIYHQILRLAFTALNFSGPPFIAT
jgi:hypothetical protein